MDSREIERWAKAWLIFVASALIICGPVALIVVLVRT